MYVAPDMGQRKDATNRGKSDRGKAAEMSDGGQYGLDGRINGIFGAEGPRLHQPRSCRMATGAGSPMDGL